MGSWNWLGVCLLIGSAALAPGLCADEKKPEAGWKSYTSKEGRFSVRFPVEPKRETRKGGSGAALEFLSAEVPGLAYSVNYTDLPPEAEKVPAGNVIDSMRNSLVRLTKGKLVEETYVDLKPYHGRQLRIESPDKSTTVFRLFVIKHRVYQLSVLTLPHQAAREDTARFFDSFRLAK